MRASLPLLLLAGACAPGPPLPFLQDKPPPQPSVSISVARDTLVADGVDHTAVTATFTDQVTRDVVIRFTTSGGILTGSAVPPDADGHATVTLVADREEDMGGLEEKRVVVRAIVELGDNLVATQVAEVAFRAPTAGNPLLFLTADPPAADADGASTVTLTATARRMDPGTVLTFATTAGTLSAPSSVLDAALHATVTLVAPAAPANARVTVTDAASGASGVVLVSFVPAGAPQFDLTGVFAQLAVVRVRLSAGTLRPDPQCVVAPSILRMDLAQNDHDLAVTFTTCHVTLPAVTSIAGTVTNETPPAFLAAIPRVTQQLRLAETTLGTVVEFPRSVVVVGAELGNPADDGLPSDADDPRVRDSDNDGQPGVTVLNSLGGEQHIVYRNKGSSRARVRSSNRLDGDVLGDLVALTETSVFGLGGSFMPDTAQLPSVLQVARVDGLNGSPRIDNDGDGELSCQEIVDAQAQVFNPKRSAWGTGMLLACGT
ncbi:MAG: hypothetical protein HY904_14795 [Deltaproteobacteria bacterium]|nr:hypothetical protein [Deltaproteobacteria bacterium]